MLVAFDRVLFLHQDPFTLLVATSCRRYRNLQYSPSSKIPADQKRQCSHQLEQNKYHLKTGRESLFPGLLALTAFAGHGWRSVGVQAAATCKRLAEVPHEDSV